MSQTWLPGDTRQRIQDLIKDSNSTQADLAAVIALSESALSRYLKGQTEMLGDGYIIRIAKHFNVSTDFLLGETDIPDRKNYDIEELGLSAESAKLLYSGKIDAHILNLLLENPRFPQLMALLSRYQNEIVKSGIAAMNQQLSFVSSLLLDQAAASPDSAVAAKQAAHDIQAIRTPMINADTTAIQNVRARHRDYIEELYLLTHPDVIDVGCEITCINHNFFVAFIQSFSSEEFLNVFLDELKSVGLNYEVIRKEPLRLCGMEAFRRGAADNR